MRCHSVFSCCCPSRPVHCRLVATENSATLVPLASVRTSGSLPRFPMIIALLRLRDTVPPAFDSAGSCSLGCNIAEEEPNVNRSIRGRCARHSARAHHQGVLRRAR